MSRDILSNLLGNDPGIENVLSELSYRTELTFLNFTLRVYERKLLSEDETNNLLFQIERSSSEVCRWKISREYLKKVFYQSDVIMIISYPQEFYKKEYGIDMVCSFIMFSYDPEQQWGYIRLTCSRQFFSSDPPYEMIKLQLGLLLRCFAHGYLTKLGITRVYTDAASEEVAGYYESLGYLYGKEGCGQDDPITQAQLAYPYRHLNNFYLSLPPDYKTMEGYRMKMCGSNEICSMAYRSIKASLTEIIQKEFCIYNTC